jgi:hypothetical protein
MCLAALAVIGPIIGAIGSVVGAMAQASAAQQKANAEAQAAQYQAAVARNNATAEAYKATEKAQDVGEQGDYKLAQQRAAFASSGAQVGTGTPITVFGESAGRIAGKVEEQQYAGRVESMRWQAQAGLKELEASNARKAGDTAAQGAIISGVFGGLSGAAKAGQALGSFG